MKNLIWNHINNPDFGLSNSISDVIHRQELLEPELLTSTRLGPTLLITSDYGGEIKESKYETLSFLVADLAFCWFWDQSRIEIRKIILSDSRRIAYKNLSDKRRKNALVPFLRAANSIPGLLITFVIDKQVLSNFSEPEPPNPEILDLGLKSKWKPKSFAKLTRVAHFGSLLVSCMSAQGQNIMWFTDEDAIAANDEKVIEATKVITHILNGYLQHGMGRCQFGTTRCDDGSMAIEDLASIPDLVAGAMAEAASTSLLDRGLPFGRVHLPYQKPPYCKKAHAILGWMADGPHPLKKMVICIDKEKDIISIKHLKLMLETSIPEYDWRNDFESYISDKIIVRGNLG